MSSMKNYNMLTFWKAHLGWNLHLQSSFCNHSLIIILFQELKKKQHILDSGSTTTLQYILQMGILKPRENAHLISGYTAIECQSQIWRLDWLVFYYIFGTYSKIYNWKNIIRSFRSFQIISNGLQTGVQGITHFISECV